MAYPAIIACLGTSTKEETLLIVVGKKEKVLIFCFHFGSVSQKYCCCAMDCFLPEAARTYDSNQPSPNMQSTPPLSPMLQQCGRKRALSFSWFTPQLQFKCLVIELVFKKLWQGGICPAYLPLTLGSTADSQVKRGLPTAGSLSLLQQCLHTQKLKNKKGSQKGVMGSRFLQLLLANSCISETPGRGTKVTDGINLENEK